MKTYQHTQRGKLILIVMSLMSAIFVLIGVTVCRPVLVSVPLLIIAGWLFHSLTIEIAEDELRWRFGPGVIRNSVRLDQIVSASAVRTNWLEGWGIHLSRFGWLYNVSGHDAVAFQMKNGQHFALGTDEPAELLAPLARSESATD